MASEGDIDMRDTSQAGATVNASSENGMDIDNTNDGSLRDNEQVEDQEEDEDDELDLDKIKMLPGASDDGTAASFQIADEDHTLGNALRYIIMKNPDVEFCGYSIPHPSETKLNIRIQTYGPETTAVQALHKGLDDLVDLCNHVEEVFQQKLTADDYKREEP